MLQRPNRRGFIAGAAASVAGACASPRGQQSPPSLDEWRAIAHESYLFGFSIVDNYRVMRSYFVDASDPEYKGRWNQVHNVGRLYTPADRSVQTPNADTPYSWVGADLRAEPLVVTLPAIEDGRYYSAQFLDLYTHIIGYAGTRTTGNAGCRLLLAGPNWRGPAPVGVDSVIHCETELGLVFFRTQLFNPRDIDNVRRIQAGYDAQPLSRFLGRAPRAAPPIDFPAALTREEERTSLRFFQELSALLRFCPVHPSEVELRRRLARIGVRPGGNFDPQSLTPDQRAAMEAGVADAWRDYEQLMRRLQAREVRASDFVGSRERLDNNYLYRMSVAYRGIYANVVEEASYTSYVVDAAGQPLNGAANRYAMRLSRDQLQLARAFWSLTMYETPANLFYANPLDRYLINAPMLGELRRDADGGVTIYVQHDSPGPDLEANWLPAPPGPFMAVLRLYLPRQDVIHGVWPRPDLERL